MAVHSFILPIWVGTVWTTGTQLPLTPMAAPTLQARQLHPIFRLPPERTRRFAPRFPAIRERRTLQAAVPSISLPAFVSKLNPTGTGLRSEEHTSELQSLRHLV